MQWSICELILLLHRVVICIYCWTVLAICINWFFKSIPDMMWIAETCVFGRSERIFFSGDFETFLIFAYLIDLFVVFLTLKKEMVEFMFCDGHVTGSSPLVPWQPTEYYRSFDVLLWYFVRHFWCWSKLYINVLNLLHLTFLGYLSKKHNYGWLIF